MRACVRANFLDPRCGRCSERALGVVEVVIAVLLLSIVVSAIALAALSGNNLRGAARVQASMTKAGQQVQEDIISDRSWMETCDLGETCDVSGVIQKSSYSMPDVDGAIELVPGPGGGGFAGVNSVYSGGGTGSGASSGATATAVDSEIDGVGSEDRDGVTPDFYKLTIVIKPSADVIARYNLPVDTTRRIVTSIDRRGIVQLGSLAVEICEVTNQSDERMSIQGCAPDKPSNIGMMGCPPQPRLGCVPAWNWVKDNAPSPSDPSPFVVAERVTQNLPFTVINTSNDKPIPSSKAKKIDGLYVFENLEAGEYRITGLPATHGVNTERWEAKEVPAFHGSTANPVNKATVAVEPGLRNRALVLFRPAPTKTGIRFYFDRVTETRRIVGPKDQGIEVIVPKWAPTTTYIGGAAEAYCEDLRAMYVGQITKVFRVDVCDVSKAQENCVDVRMEWTASMEESIDGETLTGVEKDTYCTYYTQYLTHRAYEIVGPTTKIRKGAAEAAVYAIEPKPDVRSVTGTVGTDLDLSTQRCIVKGHTFNVKSGEGTGCTGGESITKLIPGLNSSILNSNVDKSFGTITGGGSSNSKNAEKNQAVSGTPAWLVDGGIWVYPDGTMRSSAGGGKIPASPLVSLRGKGECYWRSPNYAGEQEGSCDPCTPMWKIGMDMGGACKLLRKTCWTRDAIERNKSGDRFTLPSRGGCYSYAPPWVCSSTGPATVKDGNCKAPAAPPKIPLTNHPTPSGGNAQVGSSNINSAPGGF